MTALRNVVAFPEPRKPRRDYETAFLPAALEVIETPPSPIGRAIGATIIALFCVALIWASLGSVDIVATAPGKIIPGGRTKVVQPFEAGVVRAIHVRDGAVVKAGDVLIEIDPTINAAEGEHAKGDLMAAQLDVARLQAALTATPEAAGDFAPPEGASPAMIDTHRRFLLTQTAEHNARLAEIDGQLAQKRAERATIDAMIAKLEAIIPPLQERVNVRRYLFDKQVGSKLTYLTEFQDLVGQQHDLLIQQSRQKETDAAIVALAETRSKTAAEFRRAHLDDLSKAQQKVAGLAQDVIKTERRTKLQALTAPIDGMVQQLAVHTVGGVVTPAQALAIVVPLDSALEIEAMVPNGDIGFVEAGQEAEVKIDTFDFTRYGLLQGRVSSVSRDVIADDRRDDAARGKDGASEPKLREPVYAARVVLDRTHMDVEGKAIHLLPGMSVTVEIKTGSRRIISYLLSPLMRYRQEVMRER